MTTDRFHDLRPYKPAELARELEVSEKSIREAARSGAVPHHRLTGRQEIRFTADQVPGLVAYLISRGTTAAAARSTTATAAQEPAATREAEDPRAQAALLLAGVRSLRR